MRIVMSDLPQRLRHGFGGLVPSVCDEAANEIERLTAEVTRLQQIIAAYYDGWPEPWADCMDGFEMQDFAEKHGIMDRVEKTTPCGENCSCSEYHGSGETVECFVLRPEFRVSGRPASCQHKYGDDDSYHMDHCIYCGESKGGNDSGEH